MIQTIRNGLVAAIALATLGVVAFAAPSASASTSPTVPSSAASAASTSNCALVVSAALGFEGAATTLGADLEKQSGATTYAGDLETALSTGLTLWFAAEQLPSCVPPIKGAVAKAIAAVTAALGTIAVIYKYLTPIIDGVWDIVWDLLPIFG